MRRSIIAGGLAAALAVPAAAGAHVTVQPKEVPAGGFAKLDVRVPNERDEAGTTKVRVQFPDGFAFASYQPVPGWTVEMKRGKPEQPVEVHGQPVDEVVREVTFTGDGKTGIIKPGQFQDFPLSVSVPEGDPGTTLTFKAIQTYESGEVVRWIGPPDSEEPAAQITLTEGGGHGAAQAQTEPTAAEGEAAPVAGSDDDGDGNGLAIAALIVGALGLLAGGAGLAAARRAQAAA